MDRDSRGKSCLALQINLNEDTMIVDKWENLSNLHFSKQWDDIIHAVQVLRQEKLAEGTYDLCHNEFSWKRHKCL